MDKNTLESLLKHAKSARNNSYSPYSGFRVGAALLAASGNIYSGTNVVAELINQENASYGGAICAERSAFVAAVSAGERKFVAIAIVTDKEKSISPCGMCRQFMVEFGKDLKVIKYSTVTLLVSNLSFFTNEFVILHV